jgi:hypothetical protein
VVQELLNGLEVPGTVEHPLSGAVARARSAKYRASLSRQDS